MSATITGLITLENGTPVEDSPGSLIFDGQIWLGPGRALTGVFRYYNSNNDSFPPIGHYFAWIHVARFEPSHQKLANKLDGDEQEHDDLATEQVLDDDTNNSIATRETLDNDAPVNVVGDIVDLIQVVVENLRRQVYLNVSGAAVNSNKTRHFFQVFATQYTTHYKHNRTLSILPVHASFDSNKYKSKKPIPSDNTYVAFEGKLVDVQVDSTGKTCFLHVSVDNINFLGRATLGACSTNPSPTSTLPRSARFKFNLDESPPPPSSNENAPSTSQAPHSLTDAGISTRAGKRKK